MLRYLARRNNQLVVSKRDRSFHLIPGELEFARIVPVDSRSRQSEEAFARFEYIDFSHCTEFWLHH